MGSDELSVTLVAAANELRRLTLLADSDTTRYDRSTTDKNTYREMILGAFDKGQDGKASGPSPPLARPNPAQGAVLIEFGSHSGAKYHASQRIGGPTSRVNTR